MDKIYAVMTLQQLEYIVALARQRHFVKAAEQCGVTQPTLSAMILKLEEELGVALFDRTKHPVEPTPIGEAVVGQAQVVLSNIAGLHEIISQEKESLGGELRMAVIPTVSPYLLPDFLHHFREHYPAARLHIREMLTPVILEQLRRAETDLAILATPLSENEFFSIPLYYEKFAAYVSPLEEIYGKESLSASDMPLDHLWVLQEGHCIRNQVFNFCHEKARTRQAYEAGSIDTLVKIVDRNGGYTVIPELHIGLLDETQRRNVRPIADPPAVREISIVIRRDFIRERMLNAVADTVKSVIPREMLDERLRKFAIRI